MQPTQAGCRFLGGLSGGSVAWRVCYSRRLSKLAPQSGGGTTHNCRYNRDLYASPLSGSLLSGLRSKLVSLFYAVAVASRQPCLYAQSASNCTPCPPDRVACCSVDKNALDAVGINHGILRNEVGCVVAEVSRAFLLDDIDDYVQVP